MRDGIPQKSGKLAFNAFNQGTSAMVSANAFWSTSTGQFKVPMASDIQDIRFALDSAGFVAHQLFKVKGKQPGIAGIYPWSYEQYVALAADLSPDWWSAPDLACEAELAGNQAEINYRIDATATLHEGRRRLAQLMSSQTHLSHQCSSLKAALCPTTNEALR